ncbi:MAG: hypothetical protein HYW37_01205 [Candidatus Colwellbacteria bacterium]|nr:hypothetical protein [Candidatus Colwellbacteria bacterium]
MPRTLKQILYGFGFLTVLGVFSLALYKIFLVPSPTCFDNVRNGKEEGIDCGGGCIACELKTLKLITSPVEVKAVGKKTTLIEKITNPSSNYGLRVFDYNFEIYGSFGVRLATIESRSLIQPSETKYLIAPGVDIDPGSVSTVKLNILNSSWERAENLPNYQYIEIAKTGTASSKDGIEVSGILKNKSAADLKSVKVKAVIFSETGQALNASETEISELRSFSESPFRIFFPKVAREDEFDLGKTNVFAEIVPR